MGLSTGGAERCGVVVLAGGTGGAKLARGMLDLVGAQRLTVIANTGDDIEIYGASVSPDPDLVTFWLADLIDERGWGLAGDTFKVMDGLRELGHEVWFNLGDRDLAWCIERTRLQQQGMRPTQALAELCARIGLAATVLPMCDTPVRTVINGVGLQEFMIRHKAQGPVREVRFEMPGRPAVSPELRAALAGAEAVIVGPSNPVISIWPILTAIGEELSAVAAPVVCVSPVVGGEIVKGPTSACLEAYGHPLSAAGVAAFYEKVAPGLIDGILSDDPVEGDLPRLHAEMLMDGAAGRARLADAALSFARTLRADS
ncbi:MAG: 2-phospho-L-lactate transferase CofD family protein [Solirubrobacteraceae bacterium]